MGVPAGERLWCGQRGPGRMQEARVHMHVSERECHLIYQFIPAGRAGGDNRGNRRDILTRSSGAKESLKTGKARAPPGTGPPCTRHKCAIPRTHDPHLDRRAHKVLKRLKSEHLPSSPSSPRSEVGTGHGFDQCCMRALYRFMHYSSAGCRTSCRSAPRSLRWLSPWYTSAGPPPCPTAPGRPSSGSAWSRSR